MTCTEPTAKRMTSIQLRLSGLVIKFSPIMYITKMVVDRSDVQSKKGKVQLEMSVLAKISRVSGVG